MRQVLPLAALLLGFAAPVGVQAAPSPANGKVVFDKWCAPCHARTPAPRFLPGSEALRVKYNGQKPPHVEDWTDLTADYVKFIVRNGVQAMPFTRKTEVSDPELDDLAAYLARAPARQ